MENIEIDFEVYKHLTMMRESEEMTYNDVLRNLLELGEKKNEEGQISREQEKAFVSKGVHFPHGTNFRATYKGKNYYAEVKNGALVFQGQRHTSPSSAAIAITENPVNGWLFWECQFPDKKGWTTIKSLR